MSTMHGNYISKQIKTSKRINALNGYLIRDFSKHIKNLLIITYYVLVWGAGAFCCYGAVRYCVFCYVRLLENPELPPILPPDFAAQASPSIIGDIPRNKLRANMAAIGFAAFT